MTARLDAANLYVRFGAREAVRRVSLTLHAGETVGLLGPNGAGKSTLMRALAGLLPYGGTIALNGSADLAARDRARLIGYLAQGREIGWDLSVRRIVALGRMAHADRSEANEAAIAHALDATGTADLADRPVMELSGGERARVLLARVLAGEPQIILADEPTANLDPRYQIETLRLLRHAASGGAAVLVSLHDLNLASLSCDRVIIMDDGAVAADGPPGRVLTADLVRAIFGIEPLETMAGGVRFFFPGPACTMRGDRAR
jgi:iron complex transport system ATP-binding protein